MRNLRVRVEIDIYAIEHDPFTIRRRHWCAEALQFHHVLKRERVLLCEGTDGEKENRNEKSNPHVNCNTDVVEALVSSAYLFSSVLENKHRYNIFRPS